MIQKTCPIAASVSGASTRMVATWNAVRIAAGRRLAASDRPYRPAP